MFVFRARESTPRLQDDRRDTRGGTSRGGTDRGDRRGGDDRRGEREGGDDRGGRGGRGRGGRGGERGGPSTRGGGRGALRNGPDRKFEEKQRETKFSKSDFPPPPGQTQQPRATPPGQIQQPRAALPGHTRAPLPSQTQAFKEATSGRPPTKDKNQGNKDKNQVGRRLGEEKKPAAAGRNFVGQIEERADPVFVHGKTSRQGSDARHDKGGQQTNIAYRTILFLLFFWGGTG